MNKKSFPPNEAFGQVLRSFRKARGMSQEQLALGAELQRVYISMLERGLRQPTLGTLLRIAHALGCSGAEIVEATEVVLKKQIAERGLVS